MSVCGTVHCLNQYNITKTKFNFIEHNKRRKTDQMYIFDLQHNPVDKFTPRENNRMFLPLCLIGEQKAKTEMQQLGTCVTFTVHVIVKSVDILIHYFLPQRRL